MIMVVIMIVTSLGRLVFVIMIVIVIVACISRVVRMIMAVVVIMTSFSGLMGVIVVMVMSGFRSSMPMIVTVAMIAVIMGIEGTTLAEVQLDQIVGIHQLDCCCASGNVFERIAQKRFQIGADPEDDISRLQHGRFRRAHCVSMGGARSLDDQTRFAHTVHDTRNKRIDRLDGCDDIDIGLGGDRRCRQQCRSKKDGFGKAHDFLLGCTGMARGFPYNKIV